MPVIETVSGVVLNVTSPDILADFYTEHLGMTLIQSAHETRLGYVEGASILFRTAQATEPYQHHLNDRYWKIGITLPNVNVAYEQLIRKGVQVSPPRQFLDIGYLCHITDPEGFQIELIQHTFEGQPKTSNGDGTLPLGGGARISHITLRTTNIVAELELFQSQLGMRLISIQAVPNYNFDLYFLAFTHDRPPHSDLNCVDNRPWLLQRPYAVLEIQHRKSPGIKILPPAKGRPGFVALEMRGHMSHQGP